MNRRNFVIKSFLGLMGVCASITNVLAEVIWVKEGTLAYKNVSPLERMKKNEKCITCKWFKDDGVVKDGGLCTLKAISKGKLVYVKKEGVCSMWSKKV